MSEIVKRIQIKVKNGGIWGLIFSLYNITSSTLSTKVTTAFFKYLLNSCGEGTRIKRNAKIHNPEKISIGKNVLIENYAILNASFRSPPVALVIGDYTSIRQYSMIQTWGGTIKIGSYCNIKPFCTIYGLGNVKIGDYVLIATGSVVVAQNHIYSDPSIPIGLQGETGKGITIEDNVWICAGVKILDGVTIGTGSVIGAGAVITKDIPPFSVASGIPAEVIKKRNKVDI